MGLADSTHPTLNLGRAVCDPRMSCLHLFKKLDCDEDDCDTERRYDDLAERHGDESILRVELCPCVESGDRPLSVIAAGGECRGYTRGPVRFSCRSSQSQWGESSPRGSPLVLTAMALEKLNRPPVTRDPTAPDVDRIPLSRSRRLSDLANVRLAVSFENRTPACSG